MRFPWFRKKKLPPPQAPVNSVLGTFHFDPKSDEWTCELADANANATLEGTDFQAELIDRFQQFLEARQALDSQMIAYMNDSWEGDEEITSAEFLNISASQDGDVCVSYAFDLSPDYGIIIDLDDSFKPKSHIWYD